MTFHSQLPCREVEKIGILGLCLFGQIYWMSAKSAFNHLLCEFKKPTQVGLYISYHFK